MSHSDDKPVISIYVLSELDETDFLAVREELQSHFHVEGGVAAAHPPAFDLVTAYVNVEVLASTVQAVSISLFGSFLYDAFKAHFLKPKPIEQTLFEFEVVENEAGDTYSYASLETNDEEVLKAALSTFKDLAAPESRNQSFEFDEIDQHWKSTGVHELNTYWVDE